MTKQLEDLFTEHFGHRPDKVETIAAYQSRRQIFRLSRGSTSCIGVSHTDIAQNRAFIEFTRHFLNNNLPVPKIYLFSHDLKAYLEEDFGDLTLYDLLIKNRSLQNPFPEDIERLYFEALSVLPRFQILAGKTLDYKFCSRAPAYDFNYMMHDLHQFRDRFLKKVALSFDEPTLEKNFIDLAEFLVSARQEYFLYRDFQARNIMIKNGNLYFIDYQGGKKGALQYDIASLLYQSQAGIPYEARQRLLNHYLTELSKYTKVDKKLFLKYYQGFKIIHLLHVLSQYGQLGLESEIPYFLNGIPAAIKTIISTFKECRMPVRIEYLEQLVSMLESYDENRKVCLGG